MSHSLADLTRVFARIGVLSFGGPAAQIALMHRELVEDRDWLDEAQFLRALSLCMLLPGPEAMQLATYAGWKLRGIPGGLIAGGLFVLPGAMIIAALALAYGAYGDLSIVQAAFLGIKATVIVIVAQAILRLSRKALGSLAHRIIAVLSFAALFFLSLPFPLVIALAALWGAFAASGATTAATHSLSLRRSGTVLAIGGLIWAAPLALAAFLGADLLLAIGLFFSKLAVVTFGGAYAVLAYMTQEVVANHGWISTGQMLDALGLAETTPGPLILVTEFVGITAGLSGGVALGLAAGVMTLWVTFVPCFIWIFAGAPLIDWLEGRPRPAAALTAITAAVVGVIANLSLWFAAHVFFATVDTTSLGPLTLLTPILTSFQPLALILTGIAAALLIWRRLPLLLVLPVMAALGAGSYLVAGAL